jgi:hypothetical protein
MALRFVAIDPETQNGGSPTVWVGFVCEVGLHLSVSSDSTRGCELRVV